MPNGWNLKSSLEDSLVNCRSQILQLGLTTAAALPIRAASMPQQAMIVFLRNGMVNPTSGFHDLNAGGKELDMLCNRLSAENLSLEKESEVEQPKTGAWIPRPRCQFVAEANPRATPNWISSLRSTGISSYLHCDGFSARMCALEGVKEQS
jgi:hypothetical protein